ncbi:hypothetical protein BCR39DRAFT_533939 [Naematelia encephala]|uniref:Serine/threonine-protein kinase Tel1 n=1 Tax=Naematelia encephala TaxID=71784 RepID=A0A1Y2B1S7_9TREE|nr:hypothetical protein BCR39DRAFT_533939 [Naematelia encephala]
MNKVPGLQAALKLYSSDKVKERAQGHDAIRGIFSSRENLSNFQETAAKQGGEGWIAFFQCLFQVVVTEKKAALKKGASTQADRRLAEAISLVRWMAERSVHLLSRKPFLSIFTHMSHLLVYGSNLFPPATLDYAKAMRTLLSYPPHLANLDQTSWRLLMGICWSAVLGDEVSIEREWQDEENEVIGDVEGRRQDEQSRSRTITQATSELASLIPILLSSSSAPLLATLHEQDTRPSIQEPCYGYTVLLKIHRFFQQFPTETSAHLLMLRSLNVVLGELELNRRVDFAQGGMKVLPQLITLWQTRNKVLREQLVVALRMLLPYLCHSTNISTDKAGVVHEWLSRLSDMLAKESSLRGGIRPLDMSVIRLQMEDGTTGPFRTHSFLPGFDFGHECAMTWAILELYADITFHLYDHIEGPTLSTPNSRRSKRMKMDNPVVSLIQGTIAGQIESRLLSLQVLIFTVDRVWQRLDSALQTSIREVLAKLLDEEDEPVLQSWALIGVACLAKVDDPSSPVSSQASNSIDLGAWATAWQHSMRKIILPNLSRAASHAALAIIRNGKVDKSSAADLLGSLLRNVEFQGPSYPYDSVCHLLSEALQIARTDSRLYSAQLEDHVLRWLQKWRSLDGTRGKSRMDPLTPADLLSLLSSICRLSFTPIPAFRPLVALPDCALVDRILEEFRTKAIREFILDAKLPAMLSAENIKQEEINQESEPLAGCCTAVAGIICRELAAFTADWTGDSSGVSPPERLRRTIDLTVLALLFQGLLIANGQDADDVISPSTEKLLKTIEATLKVVNSSIPSQLLVWQGFVPLFGSLPSEPDSWGLLVTPGQQSGIRQDVLASRHAKFSVDSNHNVVANSVDEPTPPSFVPSSRFEASSQSSNPIVEALWGLPMGASLLQGIQHAAQGVLASSPTPISTSTQAVVPIIHEDDDFGEIRTADSDAMPVSREALDCHLASKSLASIVTLSQLAHPALSTSSQSSQSTRGRQFLEHFLSTDGPRFVQLGQILCETVQAGLLRLTVPAVEAVFDALEEMISSYAYARDEGLVLLTIDFLIASMPSWSTQDLKDDEVTDRAFNLMRFILLKAKKDQLPSWRVRLSVIRLVDLYLTLDLGLVFWNECSSSEAETDEDLVNPLDSVTGGLLDRDARVRFRAAVSASNLFSVAVPTERHMSVYQTVIERLPALPEDWDGFLTDLLWKLNCCIASVELRAATIFHLYEIPASSSDFNQHLQNGLDAVSAQLGFDSSATLYLAHAVVVVKSQLASEQSPLRVPHRIYGFPSRRSFAVACLGTTTPAIVCTFKDDEYGPRARALFSELCKAAEIKSSDVILQHFPATSAMSYAADQPALLASLPGLSPSMDQFIAENRASILAELFIFTNSAEDPSTVIDLFKKRGLETSFAKLLATQPARAPPQTWSLSAILSAYDKLLPPGTPTTPITLLTLHRLFDSIHKAFLLSERDRYLATMILLISLHWSDLKDATISRLLRRELRALSNQADLPPLFYSIAEIVKLDSSKAGADGDSLMLESTNDGDMHIELIDDTEQKPKPAAATLLEKLYLLLRSNDNNIRRSAFDALRGMAALGRQMDAKVISGDTTALLRLLTPPSHAPGLRVSFTPDSLTLEGSAWLFKAKDPLLWARDMALLMTSVIGVLEPAYWHMQILLQEQGFDARRILPFLTKIFLSEEPGLSASTGKARAMTLSTHFEEVLKDHRASTESKRVIVDIIVYLRHHQPPYDKDILGYNRWLSLDPLLLAFAASTCNAFVTSLMFLEAAVSEGPNPVVLSDQDNKTLLYEIYSNVDDPDGFYGISDTNTWNALSRRFAHEGEFRRRFEIDVAELEAPKASVRDRDDILPSVLVAEDLLAMGLPHVASSVLPPSGFSGSRTDSSEGKAIEVAWRVRDWSLPLAPRATSSPSGLLFSALRAVHRERDFAATLAFIEKVIAVETARIAELGRERMVEAQRLSSNLRCLQEIANWISPSVQDSLSMTVLPPTLLIKVTDLSGLDKFADAERLMSTRQSLIAAALQREDQHLIGDLSTSRKDNLLALQKACHLSIGKAARSDGNAQAALNAIAAVRQIDKKGGEMSDAAEEEYGEILWARKEYRLALQLLQQRVDSLVAGGLKGARRRAVIYSKIAHWSSISRSRLPADIDEIFRQAIKDATDGSSPLDERARISHDYAVFADSQRAFIASLPEYREAQDSRYDRETSVAPSMISSTSSKKKRESSSKASRLAMEAAENSAAHDDPVQLHQTFVKTALQHYATSLALSNQFDDSVTAMVSLWLQHSENATVNTDFGGDLQNVPSYKFIFLGPQLSARLDRPRHPIPFNDNLNILLNRMAKEHPFHILYQICTLASGYTAPKSAGQMSDRGAAGRGPKAAEILASLAADRSVKLASQAATQIKMLCDAAVEWCLYPFEAESQKTRLTAPATCRLLQCRNLAIPPPSRPPPIDTTLKYNDISPIVRYRATYALLGGVHRPKRMSVLDTTGQEFSEIFKGEDDVRQDSVMEQVFELSNRLLQRDTKTKDRRLHFRTYRVIPLARKSGIMEFVGNSNGIGEWLRDAHEKYGRPGDISAATFRSTLKPIQSKDHTSPILRQKYDQLMKRFHPVMRHFFIERHKDPVRWFEMRLNYARSVAVTSMVGHVLGIGDRHCSNVMIDGVTGELIHIDFGIVFGEGMKLRIPERVPFRLTNDIVDGLGIHGVDGTFRQCSEHTLRVLRESSELIMTVLEVLKYDPLFTWTGDPDKLKRAQDGAQDLDPQSEPVQQKANQVLGDIRRKLRDDLSVESTVNDLIQQARDPEHLAKIFVGWQSWF